MCRPFLGYFYKVLDRFKFTFTRPLEVSTVTTTLHDTDLSVAEQGLEGWMMPEMTARVAGGCGAGLRPLMPPSSVLQHTRRQDLSLGQDSCYSRLCGPTSQQHPNNSSMLYVVCDLVICCVHQQGSGQGLFQ